MIQRDASIDSDIAAARVEESDPETTSATEITGIDEYDTRNRYDRIVNDCMRQRGYVLPQKKSIFE